MNEKLYKGIPVDRIPWKPEINYNLCNGNGKCVEVCPADVFVLNSINSESKRADVARPEDCIPLCQLCADACPKKAITLPDRKQAEDLISKLLKHYGTNSTN